MQRCCVLFSSGAKAPPAIENELLHDRCQTLKSDEAKWSKLTRITPVGSFLIGNTLDFEKIRWGDGLVCLSSNYSYVLKVDEFGKEAFKHFVQTRLVAKTVPFHSPLKKQKPKTLGKTVIHKKVTSTKKKVVQIAAQINVFEQMLVLSDEHNVRLEKHCRMHSAQYLGPGHSWWSPCQDW